MTDSLVAGAPIEGTGKAEHGTLALVVGAVWGTVVAFAAVAGVTVDAVAGTFLVCSFLVCLVTYWLACWRRRRGERASLVWRPVVVSILASVFGPLALALLARRSVRRAFPPSVVWRGGFGRRLKRWLAVGVGLGVPVGARAAIGDQAPSLTVIVVSAATFLGIALGWLLMTSIEPAWPVACPYCGSRIRATSEECPRCGAPVPAALAQRGLPTPT